MPGYPILRQPDGFRIDTISWSRGDYITVGIRYTCGGEDTEHSDHIEITGETLRRRYGCEEYKCRHTVALSTAAAAWHDVVAGIIKGMLAL